LFYKRMRESTNDIMMFRGGDKIACGCKTTCFFLVEQMS